VPERSRGRALPVDHGSDIEEDDMLRIITTAACAALALGAGACGADDGPAAEERRVLATVQDFHRHLASSDHEGRACAMLTADARRAFTEYLDPGGDCASAARMLRESWSAEERRWLPHIRVLRVRIDGDRAVIADADVDFPRQIEHLRGAPDPEGTVLRRTRGRWLLERPV